MAGIEYVVISTQALAEVVIVSAAGYMLHMNKAGLKLLADVSISILTPALLFAKITKSLDRQMLAKLWLVPVLYVVLGLVGLVWTRWGGQKMRLPDGFRRLCSVAVFFSNVNIMLIPIIQGIASSPDSRFLLRDKGDTPDAMADRSIAYGMIIAVMNNLLRWSVGVAIMTPPKGKGSHALNTVDSFELIGMADQPPMQQVCARSGELLAPTATGALAGEDASRVSSGMARSHVRVVAARRWVATLRAVWDAVSPCLTPPLCSVLAAVFVVLLPALQSALLKKGTYAFSVWASIDTCGEACVPVTLLALGGQLGIPREAKPGGPGTDYITERELKLGVVLVLVGRFLVAPVFTCGALLAIYNYAPWLAPLLRGDPALFLTLAIASATPPAISLLTVAQKLGMYESEAASILSWAYAIGVVALAIEVSIFLWLASCTQYI
ncbi:hypothetical protein IWW37_000538 [Coemansia sp. RSA 2050]|nr:hypothetical protein IWW37_000538 [Coemansia sp. RSA 2050]KAJ2736119.1 hypothetical protein IW152_001064 [Coemansia sp. BCRC 34962]